MKQKTKLEILQETIDYYGEDVNRRALEYATCVYLSKDDKMCVVGRCVIEKFLNLYATADVGVSVLFTLSDNQDLFLKSEYRGHDKEFWHSLQILHDDNDFWNENKGLSDEGLDKIKSICKEYNISLQKLRLSV